MDRTESLPGATHLECTGTGDRIESEQLVGLSPVGKPLFARYDLDAIREGFTPEAVRCRPYRSTAAAATGPGHSASSATSQPPAKESR